jgi:hypothetical protein
MLATPRKASVRKSGTPLVEDYSVVYPLERKLSFDFGEVDDGVEGPEGLGDETVIGAPVVEHVGTIGVDEEVARDGRDAEVSVALFALVGAPR